MVMEELGNWVWIEQGNIHTSSQRAKRSGPVMVIPVQAVHIQRATAIHENLDLLIHIFSFSLSIFKSINDVLNSKMLWFWKCFKKFSSSSLPYFFFNFAFSVSISINLLPLNYSSGAQCEGNTTQWVPHSS